MLDVIQCQPTRICNRAITGVYLGIGVMTCHHNYNLGSTASWLVAVVLAAAAVLIGGVAAVGAVQLSQIVPRLATCTLLL